MSVRERCNTRRRQDVLHGVLQSQRLLTVEEDEENLSSPDGGAGGGREGKAQKDAILVCEVLPLGVRLGGSGRRHRGGGWLAETVVSRLSGVSQMSPPKQHHNIRAPLPTRAHPGGEAGSLHSGKLAAQETAKCRSTGAEFAPSLQRFLSAESNLSLT